MVRVGGRATQRTANPFLAWSASPLVAAHFACGDVAQKDSDGVIWCLHAGVLRDINEANLQNTNLSHSLKGIAWGYDTRLLEEVFGKLHSEIQRHLENL